LQGDGQAGGVFIVAPWDICCSCKRRPTGVVQVGDIAVVGFGDTVELVHPLGVPFTAESGAKVLSKFTFNNESTRIAEAMDAVLKLLVEAKDSVRESSATYGSMRAAPTCACCC
jgi:midasin (ATPase involved in ribosome maturation)